MTVGSILISSVCNQNCIFCSPSDKRKSIPLTNRDIELWLEKINERSIDTIVFSGAGEPLSNPNIYKYIRTAVDYGCRVFLYTNGTLLNESSVKKLGDHGLRDIMVSIHGCTEESHNFHTSSPGSFSRIMKGIDLLKDFGFFIQTNTVITKYNLHDLHGIAHLLIEHKGIDELAFSYPEIVGNAKINSNILVKYEEAARSLLQLLETNKPPGNRITVENIPFCILDPSNYIPMFNTRGYYKDAFLELYYDELPNPRKELDKCINCSLKKECTGVDLNYPFELSFS